MARLWQQDICSHKGQYLPLGQMWCILRAGPETLSPDHDKRHELLQQKLRGGRERYVLGRPRSRRLTIMGKEWCDRGLMFLVSEIATVQGCDLAAAKAEISNILGASLAAGPAV